MGQDGRDTFQAWLAGHVVLFALLGASLALFLTEPALHASYALPHLRLVIATIVTLAAGVVAVLTGARFGAEGRRVDLLLSTGFSLSALSRGAFIVAPAVAERSASNTAVWASTVAETFAAICIAAAPFARGRVAARERTLGGWLLFIAGALLVLFALLDSLRTTLPDVAGASVPQAPPPLMVAYSAQALLALVMVVGFGLRYRNLRDDLDSWLALAGSLLLFSSLYLVFTPRVDVRQVSQGDFLRVLAFCVLLVGVWRAIRAAEFGRVVADERARVAREIHDGLAQYLFAISTTVALLERGGSPQALVPQLKDAATAAQQEARFAILALSSASGRAPFDTALRRYVDVLTADGALDVELEIDPAMRLDTDEQIELFRIVQEGLANARRHAGATHVDVTIEERSGRRLVTITDDGVGFDGDEAPAGQGLRNMRARSASIGGDFRVRTSPGAGTALEVALRM